MNWAALLLVPALVTSAPALAQEAPAASQVDNDGTDPTLPIKSARLAFEHLDLPQGFASDAFTLDYNKPFGDGLWIIRPSIRVAALNIPGDGGFHFGDASLKLTRILARSQKGGMVGALEIVAPTASRDFLGGGKWVAKPSFVYAIFLKGGQIFAPAILQTISFAGDRARADINLTTIDFYFVPRLSNKKLFMTLDPAINHDWQSDKSFGAFAVTLGYRLGPTLGGQSQVSIKPSVGIGGDRPFNWGIQANFQLLGF